MNRTLYTLLLYLMMPVILLRLYWRGFANPGYRNRIGERFARFDGVPEPGGIWLHSVSVGETIAAAPMVKALLAENPQRSITITTTTPTGSERVKALFGDRVFHVFAPYDIPVLIRRFLDRIAPSQCLVMETELWPNSLAICRQRGIKTLLANARLSQKSAQGYGRFPALSRELMDNLDIVAAQNKEDGARFVELGLAPDCLQVTGSIKFDIAVDAELAARARELQVRWRGDTARPIWIAASTHAGEDEIILQAHKYLLQQHPQLLLVLVPRHPERFDTVADLIETCGLGYCRRSFGEAPDPATQVILGDTMGEMLLFFGCADIAFVGGSLIERGGHNMLEACVWGLPVVCGPHLFNFREISQALVDEGAMLVVEDSKALERELGRLLGDRETARNIGAKGKQVMDKNRGALERLLNLIRQQA